MWHFHFHFNKGSGSDTKPFHIGTVESSFHSSPSVLGIRPFFLLIPQLIVAIRNSLEVKREMNMVQLK